jgi:hypothetical protein
LRCVQAEHDAAAGDDLLDQGAACNITFARALKEKLLQLVAPAVDQVSAACPRLEPPDRRVIISLTAPPSPAFKGPRSRLFCFATIVT